MQATYLVQPGLNITKMEEVDQPGVRIVAKARSAYDLWLTENIQQAEIIRSYLLTFYPGDNSIDMVS